MAVKEAKEDVETTLRLIGWQVAAGILFVAFGLELAFSNIIMHALQPLEHGKTLLASMGLESLGMQGFSATVLIIVGSLNFGVAAFRFAKVLQFISDK